MALRVFVKVVGFSAAERHALNTVFRLSRERQVSCALWLPESPEAPALLLLDGDSPQAKAELGSPSARAARLIWVGADAPARSWRVFERPISWPDVIQGIEDLFEPATTAAAAACGDLDFDLGAPIDAMDTQPPDTLPPQPPAAQPRALVASADRDQRLYLRARLALAGLTTVDEADSAGQAVELAKRFTYAVAIVEHRVPGVDAWFVLERLRAIGPDRPAVILAKSGASLLDRLRARTAGAAAFLSTPPEPAALDAALRQAIASGGQAAPSLAVQPR